MSERRYGLLDRLIGHFDRGLRTVSGTPVPSGRPNPAGDTQSPGLAAGERRHAARLMRVNHTGEVCAQALYQGQALTARDPAIQRQLARAAEEETEHLTWCRERVAELGGRTSVLDPMFYLGALALGAGAGAAGDRWNLGFLAETERQVVRHLEGHLDRLPPGDARSRAIVERMRDDERAHASTAVAAGAAELPRPLKGLMAAASRVMTRSTYWV